MLTPLQDFLDDDINFNWVQIFRHYEPLRPMFDDNAASAVLDAENEQSILENKDRVKDFAIERSREWWESQHPDASKDLMYLPSFDSKLVKIFGHDNHGVLEEQGDDADGPRTIESAVAQDLDDPKPSIRLIGNGKDAPGWKLDEWAISDEKYVDARKEAVELIKSEWTGNEAASPEMTIEVLCVLCVCVRARTCACLLGT
jgi:hypothetical protein|eukprot:Tamp_01363.p3 GENE.Tamp_01363~~Tamp_01363.p3  ORF type:complete len:201 (+),score=41.65 Tamp_01363:3529-4131(+)